MFKYLILASFILVSVSTCDPSLCICQDQNCTQCLVSYMYKLNSTCIPCPYNCATCDSQIKCTKCQDSYYLNNGLCSLCPFNCQRCQSLNCSIWFALKNGVCTACNDPNALSCQQVDFLNSCKGGFWQNGNSCSPCRQFCLVCSSPSNCMTCMQGYTVAVSFGSYCAACSNGCSKCTSTGCTTCKLNFKFNAGVCIDMNSQCKIDNCIGCSFETGTICVKCAEQYYLQNNKCILGASLLCPLYGLGPNSISCSSSCSSLAYPLLFSGSSYRCIPSPWNGANNLYFYDVYNLNSTIFFINSQMATFLLFPYTFTLSPYYKLTLQMKLLLFGGVVYDGKVIISLTDNDLKSDNLSVLIYNQTSLQYLVIYPSITSKNIKNTIISMSLSYKNNLDINQSIAISEIIIIASPCPSNCQLCFNSQLCQQCILPYALTPSFLCVLKCNGYLTLYIPDFNNYTSIQCVLKCPNLTYIQIEQSLCKPCIKPCLSCLSSNSCLSCLKPFLFYDIAFSCVQKCPLTHFNANNATCALCIPPCNTCTDQKSCLSCSLGFLYNSSCLSICPSGTFQNISKNTCDSCDFTCLTCSQTSKSCLSCQPKLLLFQSKCLQLCPSTRYYISLGKCEACLTPCLTCESMTSCLSCSNGFLYNKSCLNTCPNGYYASNTTICLPCNSTCFTCTSDNFCTSCKQPYLLNGYQCVLNCSLLTYPQLNICKNCLYPCGQCTSKANCSTCLSGFMSQIQIGKCLLMCQNGYYGDKTNSKCSKCPLNCSLCSSNISCTECISGFLLYINSCISKCPNGYYQYSNNCLSCMYPCSTCQITAFNCSSCQDGYIYYNKTCQSECPQTTYFYNNTCHPCKEPCFTCSNDTFCLSCKVKSPELYLYIGSCISKCPLTYYAQIGTLTCEKCIFPCLNCISQLICLSCQYGYFYNETSSCGVCPLSYYGEQSTKQCIQCKIAIKFCFSCISKVQCWVCESNYYLINNTCLSANACSEMMIYYPHNNTQQCSLCLAPCQKCKNQTFCISCLQGLLLNGSCVISCSSNYFQNQSVCLPCVSPCLTCISQKQCLSCDKVTSLNIYFQNKSTCINITSCLSGNYVSSNLQCLACDPPCYQCKNNTYCSSCLVGMYIDGQCLSTCPLGYFSTVNTTTNKLFCVMCASNCQTCTNSSQNCTSCTLNLYLKSSKCVVSCGDGFYLQTSTSVCLVCKPPCKSCTSVQTCLTCLNSSSILYYGSCLANCPASTYVNQKICINCPSPCLTCELNQLKVICLSCPYGLFRTSLNYCQKSCQLQQYGDPTNNKCYKCVSPCQECKSAIYCLTCIEGYILFIDQCLNASRCPNNMFLDNGVCRIVCSNNRWADTSSFNCTDGCKQKKLRYRINNSNYCVQNCVYNSKVIDNYTCQTCSGKCRDIIDVTVEYKSIFNSLCLKLSFSKQIDVQLVNKSILNITKDQNSIDYSIISKNSYQIWLKLVLNTSLLMSNINVTFFDYYLMSVTLQKLSYSVIVTSFDLYTYEEQQNGQSYQLFAEILSIMMILGFLFNMVLNSGHLSYPIIDQYQLLFMILFLSLDYPPILNHFLYGFRYSHYLFLPQIFKRNVNTPTPDKFGVVVPDADFLNNASQAILIILISIGVLGITKLLQLILTYRRNKVQNEQITQNKIQQGIILKIVKIILARFKWNYFNDIIYSIFFSVMLFAFSQIYALEFAQKISDVLSMITAIAFIIIGGVFPFMLGHLMRKNQMNLLQKSLLLQRNLIRNTKKQINILQVNKYDIQSDQSKSEIKQRFKIQNYQILADYKCYLQGMKLKVSFGFYHIPIQYFKKLVYAVIFVYCSKKASFVLGILLMDCLLTILINCIFKPYRLSFQHIIQSIFYGLAFMIFLCVTILQIGSLQMNKNQKIILSKITVAFCLLFSICLVIFNIIIIVMEGMKIFCNKNYLNQFYQTQYIQTNATDNQQNTNLPEEKVKSQGNQEKSQQSNSLSVLDIYLKKQGRAPKYLIKCTKLDYFQSDTIRSELEEPQEIKNDMIVQKQDIRQSSDYFINEKNKQQNNKIKISNIFEKIQTLQFNQYEEQQK